MNLKTSKIHSIKYIYHVLKVRCYHLYFVDESLKSQYNQTLESGSLFNELFIHKKEHEQKIYLEVNKLLLTIIARIEPEIAVATLLDTVQKALFTYLQRHTPKPSASYVI